MSRKQIGRNSKTRHYNSQDVNRDDCNDLKCMSACMCVFNRCHGVVWMHVCVELGHGRCRAWTRHSRSQRLEVRFVSYCTINIALKKLSGRPLLQRRVRFLSPFCRRIYVHTCIYENSHFCKHFPIHRSKKAINITNMHFDATWLYGDLLNTPL